MPEREILGIHHVTAVTGRATENVRFSTRVLGLRLVKKTVNQDDVSAYHLFYADAVGSPGTDVTFLDWPNLPPHRSGSGEIARIALRVDNAAALEWWVEWLQQHGVPGVEWGNYAGRQAVFFRDFEGQRLALVDDGGTVGGTPRDRSPVPPAYQIKGDLCDFARCALARADRTCVDGSVRMSPSAGRTLSRTNRSLRGRAGWSGGTDRGRGTPRSASGAARNRWCPPCRFSRFR